MDRPASTAAAATVSQILDRLSAAIAPSDDTVGRVLEDLGDLNIGGRAADALCEIFTLLCGLGLAGLDLAAGGHPVVLDKISIRVCDAIQPREGPDGAAQGVRAALRLVASLPPPVLVLMLAKDTVREALADCIAKHPMARVRTAAIEHTATAAMLCWGELERSPLIAGPYESGSEAQAQAVRLRDWIIDRFKAFVALSVDAEDPVAAASFAALDRLLRHSPVCASGVGCEVDSMLRAGAGEVVAGGSSSGESGGSHKASNNGKTAVPLQELCEKVLMAALPVLPAMLLRHSCLQRRLVPAATRTCAALAVASLRLAYGPSGLHVPCSLVAPWHGGLDPTLLFKSGGGTASSECAPAASAGVEPARLAMEWLEDALLPLCESLGPDDTAAAAMAVLELVQAPALRCLRPSAALAAVRGLLRALPAGQAMSYPVTEVAHGGQQRQLATVAVALRWLPPCEVPGVAPSLVRCVQGVPSPRLRLAILTELSFALLVAPASGGAAAGTGPFKAVLTSAWATLMFEDQNPLPAVAALREELVTALALTASRVITAGARAVQSAEAAASKESMVGGASAPGGAAAALVLMATGTSVALQPSGVARYAVPSSEASLAAVATKAPAAYRADESASSSGAESHAAGALAERWRNLEAWLQCGLLVATACNRCVAWPSVTGQVDAHAYIHLLTLLLRLLCPVANRYEPNDGKEGSESAAARLFETAPQLNAVRSGAIEALDDLVDWKLTREGIRSRPVRLRVLEVASTYLGGNAAASASAEGGAEEESGLGAEDTAMDLVSLLQAELRALDAEAVAADVAAAGTGGYSEGDGGGPARGSMLGGGLNAPGAGSGDHAGGGGGGVVDSAVHADIINCLVKLALRFEAVAGSVLEVLTDEAPRAALRDGARPREYASTGAAAAAAGPMEEVVARATRAVELLVVRPLAAPPAAAAATADMTKKRASVQLSPKGGALLELFMQAEAGQQGAFESSASLRQHFLTDLAAAAPRASPAGERHLLAALRRFPYGYEALSAVNRCLDRHFGAAAEAGKEGTAANLNAPAALRFTAISGGSDPLVLTAAHTMDPAAHGGRWSKDKPSSGSSGGASAAAGGITLHLRACNATNLRLTGFLVELALGGGAELKAARLGQQGRAVLESRDVLPPGREAVWQVALATRRHLGDLTVHVTLRFPLAEPEPDLEGDGEPTVGDAGGGAAIAAGGGLGATGGGAKKAAAGAGDGDMGMTGRVMGGGGGGSSGSGPSCGPAVPAGCYRIPAEALLCVPRGGRAPWPVFQALWGSQAYRHCLPIRAAAWAAPHVAAAADVLALMAALDTQDGLEAESTDARRSARIWPPALPQERLVRAAWLFESWQGTLVAAVLFVARLGSFADADCWNGRLELRCGTPRCLDETRALAKRLVQHLTNGVFEAKPNRSGNGGKAADPLDGVAVVHTAVTPRF